MLTQPVTITTTDQQRDIRAQFEGAPITRTTLDRAESSLRQIEEIARVNRHCTEQMYEEAEYLLEVQRQCRLRMLEVYMTL